MKWCFSFSSSWLSRFLLWSCDRLAVNRSPAWLKSLSQAADAGRAVLTLINSFLMWGKPCNTSTPPVNGHERYLSSSSATGFPDPMDPSSSSNRPLFVLASPRWCLMKWRPVERCKVFKRIRSGHYSAVCTSKLQMFVWRKPPKAGHTLCDFWPILRWFFNRATVLGIGRVLP